MDKIRRIIYKFKREYWWYVGRIMSRLHCFVENLARKIWLHYNYWFDYERRNLRVKGNKDAKNRNKK